MIKTGAKLYWSDSRGAAIISGYAQDGSDPGWRYLGTTAQEETTMNTISPQELDSCFDDATPVKYLWICRPAPVAEARIENVLALGDDGSDADPGTELSECTLTQAEALAECVRVISDAEALVK